MGCHTWLSVPYKTDRQEIIQLAQQYLTDWAQNGLSQGHIRMYQYAIDNQLEEPVCELASQMCECLRYKNWILYKEVEDYSLEIYNQQNNTNISKHSKEYNDIVHLLDIYNIPRISGYPEIWIHSFEEFQQFANDGFLDERGVLQKINYNDKEIVILSDILSFFEKYPQGIITFG